MLREARGAEDKPRSPSGSAPLMTFPQLPAGAPVFALPHERQVPVQALSQQGPSAQKPVAHCVASRGIPVRRELLVEPVSHGP